MIGEEYVGLMSGILRKNGEPFTVPDCERDCSKLFAVGDILDYGHSAYRVTFVDHEWLKSVRIS